MENLLQLIERQRERKANRSATSSGSDAHDGATFTIDSLNSTHDVDKTHAEAQLPKQGVVYGGSNGRLQADVGAVADERVVPIDHVRHHIDEPVLMRTEANSLWKKDDPPKVIPRKVASVPVAAHQSMYLGHHPYLSCPVWVPANRSIQN